jgi:uncharacterized RmlC-like cupin family protein
MMHFVRVLIFATAFTTLSTMHAVAQNAPKKGPTSKLYLAETKGTGKIETNGQVYEPKQGIAFEASGTVMVTNNDSHQAYVLSTGTGLYLDANTEVQVNQFDQERFQSGHSAADIEPSVSHLRITIAHGTIGCCASQMVSGTTMVFATPLATINVRGRRVAISVSPAETVVFALEGTVTVRTGDKDAAGLALQPGERIVIHPGTPGQPPVTEVAPMDNAVRSLMEDEVAVACNTRKTVTFEVIEAKSQLGAGGQGANAEEIVAKPTVTVLPPNNLTVSPDRITPGT